MTFVATNNKENVNFVNKTVYFCKFYCLYICIHFKRIMVSSSEYRKIKATGIRGRYITNHDLFSFLSQLATSFEIVTRGKSVLGKHVESVSLGTGPYKILMWSQMHGNETTTTKAVLDLINYLAVEGAILKECSLLVIPILNPDGADAYTRENANNIDLNRDARSLSQPESVVLRNAFDSFRPDYCFNLHDQRTMYNTGNSDKPATVSFLAPSVDGVGTVTESRVRAIKLIVGMNKMLQDTIPGQVGRYDDAYNPNCVGDTFQTLGCPTVLFEAGHYREDYQRETTRYLIFQSLLAALRAIAQGSVFDFDPKEYFKIPENGRQFFDILIKNPNHLSSLYSENDSIGIMYEEVLQGNKINFVPKIEKIGDLDTFFGHKTYDCAKEKELSELLKNNQLQSLI